MIQMLSYGGGVQTVAMCVLVAQGLLPQPDYVIAADTGREMPSTWAYAEQYMRPLLASCGLQLHIASHDLATVDLYAKNGDVLLPVYTKTGKFSTYCSGEWKARVVQRYARHVLGVAGPITNWIGFSVDELRRVKGDEGRIYPLIAMMLTRHDCVRVIQDAGLPLPHKSRCYICPHQRDAEWLEVRADPILWADAKRIDRELRANDEHDGVWLHKSRMALDSVAFDSTDTMDGDMHQCGLGLCYL